MGNGLEGCGRRRQPDGVHVRVPDLHLQPIRAYIDQARMTRGLLTPRRAINGVNCPFLKLRAVRLCRLQ